GMKLPLIKLWLPLVWKEYFIPGRTFVWEAELKWFGFTILRGKDEFVGGKGRMVIGGQVAEGEGFDQADNQRIWHESFWMPAALAEDSRVRWEAVDDTTVKMFIPYKDGEDELRLKFDPQTHLLTDLFSKRYSSDDQEMRPYWETYRDYREFNGVLVPTSLGAAYDEDFYVYLTVDGIVYNVDVSHKLPTP
ncbi:MAG: DUF6544 family protein, partial [Anaerolineae bacterium]